MYKYVIKRLLMLIPILLGATLIVFTILNLTPGDPVEMYLGENYTEEAYESMNTELGLDKPFLVRYLNFVVDATQGNFGISYSTNHDVLSEIKSRIPNTLILAVSTIIFTTIFGVILGTISAVKQNTIFDSTATFFALFGVSMPNFWLGLMLIVVFSANLGWFPSSGFDSWKSLILPVLALGANSLAIITRMTRSSVLEVIRENYVKTAKSKGLKKHRIILRHVLLNAMIPIITISALQFGFTIGGAVVVEVVFAWPGIGRLLIEAIRLKDTPIVLAIVVIIAVLFSLINLIADILYAYVNPKIKAQYKSGRRASL